MTRSSAHYRTSALLSALLLLCAGTLRARSFNVPVWKHYRNARWGFCLWYPSTWKKTLTTDGSGVMLSPPQSVFPPDLQDIISVGALPNQPRDLDNPDVVINPHGPPMTLEQNFELGLVKDATVLEKRKTTFDGYAALISKIRYREPVIGITWISVQILFLAEHRWVVYSLNLKCRPHELASLEPVFNEIAYRTFKLHCTASPKK